MAPTLTPSSTAETSLRLWPGVVAVMLQWLIRFVLPLVVPGATAYAVLGGLAGGLAVIVWWLFFSRAPWLERLGALAVIIGAVVVAPFVVHESIADGMMGLLFLIYAMPLLCLALVTWAVVTEKLVSRSLSRGLRLATLAVALIFAAGLMTLIRTHGMTGDANSDFAWRWSKSPEEQLLAGITNEDPTHLASFDSSTRLDGAEWPGFRGPRRDGIVRGVSLDTDWAASPPVEIWRRPLGPGWSSFAVHGDVFYTQEQRGEDELVSCYRVDTGEPVWTHRDEARFWESNGGAGPRATPTLAGGRVFSLGGTGILNALEAHDGSVVWSRNAADDTGAKNPGWGFSGSPLVLDDLVIVAASGRLAAYDLASGEPRWTREEGGAGYSSPHLVTVSGVQQVVLMDQVGATSINPLDGALLWQHELPAAARIVQPAMTADGDLLVSDGEGTGSRRLSITQTAEGWTTEERWDSIRLKPYFSDLVIHKGFAYGFDGSLLASVDMATGERAWKGGRYGQGQLLLLADQDVLLVLSEQGDLALVSATPAQFAELAQAPAIDGKTWNHPVLVGDVLLVRNDREMAAFRLAKSVT